MSSARYLPMPLSRWRVVALDTKGNPVYAPVRGWDYERDDATAREHTESLDAIEKKESGR